MSDTTTISGPVNGMTFVITWGPSVASAQPGFKIDLEKVLQFYADTFVDPSPVHITINAVVHGASNAAAHLLETYSAVRGKLIAGQASEAQQLAYSKKNLPATDPTGGWTLHVKSALAGALGLGDPESSDGHVNLGVGNPLSYSDNPYLGAGLNPDLAAAAHEISEVLGRVSSLVRAGGQYSLLDLFRYSAPDTRENKGVTSAPAYFSIDTGNTDLLDFNHGPKNDLGDFTGYVGGTGPRIHDAFDTGVGGINAITAFDVTLMNVLGYGLATPSANPTLPGKTALPVTFGEFSVDLTMDRIDPGRNVAPPGEAYVITDTAFDIELLTPGEITAGAAMGVAELYVTDASVVLDLAQVQALEAASIDVVVPTGSQVVLSDTAANIQTLTPGDIAAAAAIGVTQIDAFDASIVLGAGKVKAIETANIHIVEPSGSTATLSDRAPDIEGMGANDFAALASFGISSVIVNLLVPESWANAVNGNWTTTADWTPTKVPGGGNAVTIAAAGSKKYTVTSAADVTVYSLALGATATLNLTGGTFTAFDGTDAATNSGTITVGFGATLDLGGTVANTSTGSLTAEQGGEINLTGATVTGGKLKISGGLQATTTTVTTISGGALTNDGSISATGSGGLTIDEAVHNTGDIAADGGNVTLLGKLTNSFTVEADDGYTVTLTGSVANSSTIELLSSGDATTLAIKGTVTLEGNGFVTLSDVAANQIVSNGKTATLANSNNYIAGAGAIGNGDHTLTLKNETGGTIVANGTGGLTIDTGNTVTNSGALEVTSFGNGMTIDDAVDNTGSIQAAGGGDITILGALKGTGQADIFSNSNMEFKTSATNAVVFDNTFNSVLTLGAAEKFTGTVAGLANGDGIDLADFAFSGAPKISKVTGTGAAGTTTDVTIKDGGLDVTLQLVNQFAHEFSNKASAYSLTADGVFNPGTLFRLA